MYLILTAQFAQKSMMVTIQRQSLFQTARGMGRSGNSQAFAWDFFGKATREQLNGWGVKFHSLFMGKPAGDIYVDDKGMMDTNFFSQYKEQ
jgi:hypothetical protein